MGDTVKSTRLETTANTPYNALAYFFDTMLKSKVNTAVPVRVDAVYGGGPEPTGYVDVTPLVCQRDACDNVIPSHTIYHVPYARMQGGIAALITDPAPGDLGVAVFAQQDISLISQGDPEPVQPGSFRSFNQADAIYLGGILNKKPEIWLELDQNEVATLHAPRKVVVETKDMIVDCETFTVNASSRIGLNAPSLFSGGEADGGGSFTINADIEQTGSHRSSGDQVAGSVSQMGHVHSGVQPGSGHTGTPGV